MKVKSILEQGYTKVISITDDPLECFMWCMMEFMLFNDTWAQ